MEEIKVKYPIGDQDFKSIIEGGFLYVDKTQYIKKILDGNKYYFLARPRRFGKSLFLSTLRYFFEGKRELFKGLNIDSSDWAWEPYPVLHLDLNTNKYAETGILDGILERHFRKWEKEYNLDISDTEPSQRFASIIEAAHEKTGRKVVILVDEYDKPLAGNVKIDDNLEHYCSVLDSVYSNLKSPAEHIKLVFVTGVSRFSNLSVFSNLNHLNDISFNDTFADICGITEQELLYNFKHGIERLATKQGKGYELVVKLLKQNYDGYRFTPAGSELYNPWAVLNAMEESRIATYWNGTQEYPLIAKRLRNLEVDMGYILTGYWNLDALTLLDLQNTNPAALLYQAGYLTIADYDPNRNTARLRVPNDEARAALFKIGVSFSSTTRRIEGWIIE